MRVERIERDCCEDYILRIHYARRWPSISFAFGLFEDNRLVGVCTFGTPPSAPLRTGIAGKEYQQNILELNRLCLLENKKNQASILVSRAIKLLPDNKIIISFADTSQGHKGIVYQACNFKYYGLSVKRTDWKVKGMEHKHGQTIADEFRGVKNRAEAMRAKYGDDFYLAPRPRKHRYIFIKGSKIFKKSVKINYQQQAYPK